MTEPLPIAPLLEEGQANPDIPNTVLIRAIGDLVDESRLSGRRVEWLTWVLVWLAVAQVIASAASLVSGALSP